MNGKAPKSPLTGSHVFPRKNPNPNLWRGRTQFIYNSKTKPTVTTMMLDAASRVMRCATSSPCRRRWMNFRTRPLGRARSTVTGRLDILVDLRDGFLFPDYNFFGQLCIT